MLLTSTEINTVKVLHIIVKNVDFDNKPIEIYVRWENTKTKQIISYFWQIDYNSTENLVKIWA